MTRRVLRAAAGMLLAVAIVLVAVVWVRLVLDDGSSRQVTDSASAAAVDAVVVSESAADEVSATAERAAEEVLGYSWRTLDRDVARARDLLGPEMREQYDAAMVKGQARTLRTRSVVDASTVASSVVAVTDSEAKVLLFVNERTTAKDLAEPTVELTRIVLTMRRGDDGWKVVEIDAL